MYIYIHDIKNSVCINIQMIERLITEKQSLRRVFISNKYSYMNYYILLLHFQHAGKPIP